MASRLLILAYLAAIAGAVPPGGGRPQSLSPAALAAPSDGAQLYIAEFGAGQVAVFDIAAQAVRQTIPVPDPPTGLALSADGSRLYVTGGVAAGRVHVVDVRTGRVAASIAAGHSPSAPVLSRDGKTLYVCNRFSSGVSVIDLAAQAEAARIPVTREPVAAALSPDGAHLFVANLLPAGSSNSGDVAAEISVIDTRARRVTARIRLPDGSSGVRGLCVSPDGRYVYATHLLARYQLPASQIERGWIQTNAVAIIDAATLKFVNSVLLDDLNLGAANPWGVVCTADGRHLIVAHAGTHELSLIDRRAFHEKLDRAGRGKVSDVSASASDVLNDMTFLAGIRTRVNLHGNGPRALVAVGHSVYAAGYFSGTLDAVDLRPDHPPEARTVPLGQAGPMTRERRGEMLFHDGQYCLQKWLSCSSCHPSEARPDGLNWDLMLDGVGNAKNTKSLMLAHQTPPTTWTGTRPHAEASVRAGYRYIEFVERPEDDAAAIDAWLKSLQPLPSPHLEAGRLGAAALRGKRVFERTGCAACHTGPHFTDRKQHQLGTGTGREQDTAFDTPALIEVWRTAPYLHDGRAATLKDLFAAPGLPAPHGLAATLTAGEIEDLIAFVLSL